MSWLNYEEYAGYAHNNRRLSELLTTKIYREKKITAPTMAQLEAIRVRLQAFFRTYRYPQAIVFTFGSSVNGFGTESSDLDLCLTFDDINFSGEGFSPGAIIKEIASLFRQYFKKIPEIPINSVEAITTARIPIVKFNYIFKDLVTGLPRKYSCDLSVFNPLASYNSKLLFTYCSIDCRVAILGHIVKYWAKTCGIANAKDGFLSSYAYSLMTIHYLQKIGLIPVLQGLRDTHRKKPTPIEIKHGSRFWDVSFFSDISQLPHVWEPAYLTKNLSVADLFLGFLKYYADEFNFDKNVINIRMSRNLTQYQKDWKVSNFPIEDPFNHQHDLGFRVTGMKSVFIDCCFIKSSEHFEEILKSQDLTNGNIGDAISTIFDKSELTPPWDPFEPFDEIVKVNERSVAQPFMNYHLKTAKFL